MLENYYRHRFLDSFERQVKRAQDAINKMKTDEEKKWFQMLLDILKGEKYATVTFDNGTIADVSAIAHTYTYASFFDVFNHRYKMDLTIPPTITEKLKNIFRYY